MKKLLLLAVVLSLAGCNYPSFKTDQYSRLVDACIANGGHVSQTGAMSTNDGNTQITYVTCSAVNVQKP